MSGLRQRAASRDSRKTRDANAAGISAAGRMARFSQGRIRIHEQRRSRGVREVRKYEQKGSNPSRVPRVQIADTKCSRFATTAAHERTRNQIGVILLRFRQLVAGQVMHQGQRWLNTYRSPATEITTIPKKIASMKRSVRLRFLAREAIVVRFPEFCAGHRPTGWWIDARRVGQCSCEGHSPGK